MNDRFHDLVSVVRLKSIQNFDQVAYTFLPEHGNTQIDLTYGDIDTRAKRVAAWLQYHSVAPGERVLLLYPPGIDYIVAFWGCLYAGAIAVPIYPPRRSRANRFAERFQKVVEDSQSTVALTTTALYPLINDSLKQFPQTPAFQLLTTDTLPETLEWKEISLSAEDIAFLQYTSGTTSSPKGVILSHANVLHNLEMIYQAFGHSSESRGVIWLPPYHDMGLIGGLLQPLYGGFHVTLMAPTTFLQSPFRWLETISRTRATSSGGPNFAYDLCVQRITPEQKAQLDLSSWKVAFNGAETIRQSTMAQFSAAFAGCGFQPQTFYPCYGLAESTLLVTGKQVDNPPTIKHFAASALETHTIQATSEDDPDARALVACGQSLPQHQVLIVDPQTHYRLPEEQIGEIWLAGPSVAQGYWQQPQETATTFQAMLHDGEMTIGPFLRTGDLGFVTNDQLYVTGRLKELIIIRGRNYYPQDIELSVGQCHESLLVGNGAAFTIPVADEERLIIVYELTRTHQHTNLEQLLQTIKQTIALEHELSPYAVVLIRTGSLPRTTSGKIQRQLCRSLYLEGSLRVLAETSAEQQLEPAPIIDRELLQTLPDQQRLPLIKTYLHAQLNQMLQTRLADKHFAQPLIGLGLDSLQSTELKHHIQQDLQLQIPLEELLGGISGEQLAYMMLQQLQQGMVTAEQGIKVSSLPSPDAETPLSHGQRALWFVQHATQNNHAYTLARTFLIPHKLELEAFKQAIIALINRHDNLTSYFPLSDGKPVRYLAQLTFANLPFEVVDSTQWSEEQVQQYLEAASDVLFDIEHGPLFKLVLLARSEKKSILHVSIHHLIIDAWSLPILCEELGALYTAMLHKQALPPEYNQVRYSDFVRWQNDLLTSPRGEQLRSYWQQQFTSLPPTLNLPTDYPRPPLLQAYAAGTERLHIDADLTQSLKQLCQQEQVTLSMLLLTAFSTLLQRYSNQDDICIGLPHFGRDQPEFAGLIGYCVNMLPLRIDLSGQPSFITLLQRVRQTILAGLAHQEYPFSMLVHDLHASHDTLVSALEQVAFVMQNNFGRQPYALAPLMLGAEGPAINFGALTLKPRQNDSRSAQRDLSLTAAEDKHGVLLALEYNCSLFKQATIQRLLANFVTLLRDSVAQPQAKISALTLIAPDELLLLHSWNHTQPSPAGKILCLHHFFSAQACINPDATALIFEGQHIPYAQLEQQANQLAHYLQGYGIGPDILVGLFMERTPALIICILAILKAGGAYVPLDPNTPAERMAFMISDTQLSLILTQQALLEQLPATSHVQTICIDHESTASHLATLPATMPYSQVTTTNLAYVIYTSGSTGRPKGTMITHENVIRLLTTTHDWFNFNASDIWTFFHSYAFDVSVYELWGALAYGGSLVIVPYWVSRSPQVFANLVAEQQVTVLSQTPTAFQQFMEYEKLAEHPLSLRLVIFAGEALMPSMLHPWFARHSDQSPQLVNMYGITETTVHVTAQFVRANETTSNIGRPMSDLQIYLFDSQQQLVPIGIPGELYVGGPGLARGYLQRADLTAERFLPHPFSRDGGARLYRSGDLARYRADGTLEYLGRIDQQVKIRGFRVELGEIETILARHPALRDCVVIAREDHPGRQELVAYYTLQADAKQPSVHALRSFLQPYLPAYMLPSAFLWLDRLPLTNNGKLDRRALPTPSQQHPMQEHAYVPPRTHAEKTMVDIWQQVLGKEHIGIEDNFFELGGDSILSIQIVSLAQQADLHCSVQQIFLHQCIRELVEHLLIEPVDTLPQLSASFSQLTNADRERLDMIHAPQELADAYPVSTLQAGLVFHSQFSRDYELYVTSLELAIPFKQDLFEQALSYLVTRHAMLRTYFDLTHYSETIQLVQAQATPFLEVFDLRHQTRAMQEEVISSWIEREKRHSFNWEELPLVRFHVHLRSDQTIQLTLSEPFFDGWSVSSLLTELLKTYTTLLQHQVLPTPQPLASTFAEYVLAERQQIASSSCQQFWQDSLQNATISKLPVWHSEELERQQEQEQTTQAPRIERCEVAITPELSDALKQLALQHKLPLKSILLGAHLKVMGLLYGTSDVLTGVLFNGRLERPDGERVLGIFLNALPMRLNIAGCSWLELAQRAQAAEQALLPHRRYPIGKIQQLLGSPNLFETVFNFTHFHAYQPLEQLDEIEVLNGYASEQTFFPLTTQCNLDHVTAQIRMALDYNTALLPIQQVEAIAGYYQRALQTLVRQPDQLPNNIQLFSPQELTDLLSNWNHAPATPSAPVDLLSYFTEQVEQSASKIALACGEIEITYRELGQQVHILAQALRQRQIGPDSYVGVCLERSPVLIIALLGVLKAGGAYVALDPTYPAERLAFMTQDADVALVITQEHLLKLLPTAIPEVLLLNSHTISQDTSSEPMSFAQTEPDHLAYITYTSGSTGVPKGAAVTRGNVVAFVQWALTAFTREQLAYVLASTSICFDLSVFEIFVPLSCGGTIVLAQDGLHLLEVASRYPLTLINTVPSVLYEILRENFLPTSIQVVNMGAEALPHSLATLLHQQRHALEVYDLYGPSEATVYSTYAQIPPAPHLEPAIGNPITGTYTYTLDDQMQPVPIGVPGELYLGGHGLARGYIQRPEVTATRFVPNPFSDTPGSRLYRTGDLVRYRADGQLEFLERMDLQVKIRGFRIELGEIETILTEHPAVLEAVVIVREDVPGDKRLAAYLLLRPEEKVTQDELRDFLRQRLPPQMLPNNFVFPDSLPLTLNGKVDRRALLAQPLDSAQHTAPIEAPETPFEQAIAQIWCDVLHIAEVGRADNFFSLGGHSLSATQIVARLRSQFALELTMTEFFQAATLADLASLLEQRQTQQDDDEFLTLMSQVQMLSDEEVARLLFEKGISQNGSRNIYE